MNKFKCLLLIAVLFFSSCKKDTSNNSSIVGQWQWVKAMGGGIVNGTITPQSTGRVWNINFNADLTYIGSGTLKDSSHGTYKLSIVNGSNTLTLYSSKDTTQYGYTLPVNDTLLISDEYVNGFGYYFTRK